MRGTGYWEVRKMGRVEGKSSETGFMGFVGLGNCQNRGLARITRMTRILGIFVYRRFSSGGRRYGYYGLRTQTGKFAVQTNFPPTIKQSASSKRRESEIVPTEEIIRGYKPLLQGDVVILCGLFVNITGIYKVIENFTIARLETSPAFEEFMSFCRARRLDYRWFW